jgi:hypothetical protein
MRLCGRVQNLQLARFEGLLVDAIAIVPAAHDIVIIAGAIGTGHGADYQHLAMPADWPDGVAGLCAFTVHIGLLTCIRQ